MELALALAVVFVGSYIQSSIGFGLAIISAPVLYFIDPLYVPAPITVAALVLSLPNTLRHRRAVSFQGLKYAVVGRVPGTVAGGLLLVWMEQRVLALWLGASVLAGVLLSVANVALRPTSGAMFSAGFLSGFMGTSSSIGGPPMVLVMQHQDSDFIRANLAAFFIASCLMSLLMLFAVGQFGWRHILMSLPMIPATLAGYWAAMRTLHLVSPRILRRSSLLLCSAAGVGAVLSYWA